MGKKVKCPRCFGKKYLDKRDIDRLNIGRSHVGEACDFCEGTGKVEEDFEPGEVRPNTNMEDRHRNGGFCFISTAYAKYLNKNDDCTELMLLRHYRDSFVASLPDGFSHIEEYYRIAPLILDNLDKTADRDMIFNKIIIPALEKSIELIETGEKEKAFLTYKQMVLTLKERCL